MDTLVVRRRKVANVLAGEPWVYPNALMKDPSEGPAAGLVRVETEQGQFLGLADYNPAAPIPARILTRTDAWSGDLAFIENGLAGALERRIRLGYGLQAGAVRLVNSEGDGMPGLVVDCFGTNIVVDYISLGMRQRASAVRAFFTEKLGDMIYHERMSPEAARREGCDPLLPEQATIHFSENAVRFEVPLVASQKTGFYLDQRENRRLVAMYGRGRRVLDLFSYHGAFSLAALANGAESALAVDSSNAALEAAQTNAANNGLALDVLPADVFDALDDLENEGPFSMIICDPPKLAPSRKDHRKALGAYRFLLDRSLKLLTPRGILLTSSCSQAIGAEDLRGVLAQIARKQELQLDVVASTTQPADHPWPVAFPTGRYLSSVMVERRD
jgi:23S rRNA (cytosine1962-C5)-methyltransferase